MVLEGPDLEDLLGRIEFSEIEIDMALFELDQFRSIPGTSTDKYLTRVLSSVGDEETQHSSKVFWQVHSWPVQDSSRAQMRLPTLKIQIDWSKKKAGSKGSASHIYQYF